MEGSLPPIDERSRKAAASSAAPTMSSTNATNPAGRRGNAARNATVGNVTAHLLQSKQDFQSIDDKLTEQYRYFRAEFMDAANSSGVPVPLNIVEDKSGQYYKFVQNSGPKFLFDVIQHNTENIHLVRCALSVLIIIVTLLRRKLPANFATKKELEQQADGNQVALQADPIAAWVIDSLAKIGDISSVSICIGVLISSYNASVQELAMSLLASILVVSDDAVAQMLQSSTTLTMLQNASSDRPTTAGRAVTINEDGAEPKPLKRSPTAKTKKTKINLDYRKFDSKHFNYRFNQTDYTKKGKGKKTKGSDKPSTCLSYILSVVLIQKNRHLLTAGCADVILAMLRLQSPEMCKEIAETPTCELPKLDARSKNKGERSVSKYSYNPQPEEEEMPSSGPANLILEWAGLKLLLKFLFRYEKICAGSSSTTMSRDSVSASLRLKEEFSYAHSRIFLAVCKLISGSGDVASRVLSLPGAQDLLKRAHAHYEGADDRGLGGGPAVNSSVAEDSHGEASLHTAYEACASKLEILAIHQEQLHARRGSSAGGGGSVNMGLQTFPGLPVSSTSSPSLQHSLSRDGGTRWAGTGAGAEEGSSKAHARPFSPPGRKLATPSQTAEREQALSISPSHSRSGRTRSSGGAGGSSSLMPRTALQSAETADRLGSPARRERRNYQVNLVDKIDVDFASEYGVETEKKKLYLLHEHDRKYLAAGESENNLATAGREGGEEGRGRKKAKGPAPGEVNAKHVSTSKELRQMQREAKKQNSRAPLVYNPSDDGLMQASLQSMNATTNRPLHSAPVDTREAHLLGSSAEGEEGQESDADGANGTVRRGQSSSAAAGGNGGDGSYGGGYGEDEDDEDDDTAAREHDDPNRAPDANKDLFEKLPAKPCLPRRIDPIDVITRHEDLTKIRNKFKTLAHRAVNKVENEVGYMYNGKGSISQDERARRVYAPVYRPGSYGAQHSRNASRASASKSQAGSLESIQSGGEAGGLKSAGEDDELFGSFRNSSGVLLEDVPIKPGGDSMRERSMGSQYMDDFDAESSGAEGDLSRSGKKAGKRGKTGVNKAGSVDSATSGTGAEPSILGLRLDHMDFDEADLFEGFKPIFDYPAREPEADKREAELKEDFEHLDIGRKARVQTEMDTTVDLLLP